MGIARSAAPVAVVLALALAAPAQDERTTSVARPGPSRTLRAAAVQFRSTRDLDRNVAGITAHIRRLGKEGVRVAVFPECALTGYFDDVAKATTAERLADAE